MIKCLTHKDVPEDLKAIIKDRITEDMSEQQQRDEGLKIALEYHKKLHDELNDFKKTVNPKIKPTPYVPFDKSKEINDINTHYNKLIEDQKKSVSTTKDVSISGVESAARERTIELGKIQDAMQQEIYDKYEGDEASKKIDELQNSKEWKDIENEVNQLNPVGADLEGFEKTLNEQDTKDYKTYNDIRYRLNALDRSNLYKPFKVSAQEKEQYKEFKKKFDEMFSDYKKSVDEKNAQTVTKAVEKIKQTTQESKPSIPVSENKEVKSILGDYDSSDFTDGKIEAASNRLLDWSYDARRDGVDAVPKLGLELHDKILTAEKEFHGALYHFLREGGKKETLISARENLKNLLETATNEKQTTQESKPSIPVSENKESSELGKLKQVYADIKYIQANNSAPDAIPKFNAAIKYIMGDKELQTWIGSSNAADIDTWVQTNRGEINSGFEGRIKELEKAINEKQTTQDTKQAITESKTDEGTGQAVGKTANETGNVTEPPKPPIDNTESVPPLSPLDPEATKMANAINDAHIEGKFGVPALDKIIGKLQDTDLKNIYEKVKKKIQSGVINLKDVRERLLTTKQGSEEDQAALMYDLAELKGKESELTKEIIASETGSPEQLALQKSLLEVQNEMMDNALANRVLGRTGSTIFRLRQQWVNKEKELLDYQNEYKAAKGLKDLTPQQQADIQSAYNRIRESRVKLENARMELEKAKEENAKLKEENEKLNELKDKSTTQKKADRNIKSTEAISKSKERIDKSRENLRKLGGNLNAGFDPRVAIEIGKIAAEKFYQGAVKFNELVKNVFDEVKEIFPTWTEDDVVNHILTTTDKDGKLIPTLTSKKYLESKKLLGQSNENIREKVKAYENAQKNVALQQFEWQKDRRMDMMQNRPLKERIIDNILRWQRFAVLSYPSTVLKLGAVVGHQLTLKPLKFAVQKFISSPVSKLLGIEGKQNLWGNPEWNSLAKYYSGFIKNFALTNLKEQFKGIDTKEMLYGRPMMYDEWNAARGLLEFPGRSHGYIKSFIKNPEFKFAHEQLLSHNIGKMADIQQELSNPHLTDVQKESLQKEYERYDVTDESVMESINKLSLEHSKWAILMNDNKFVEKFRKWTNDSGITGALIKSELPIIKIPINYVSRAFATKYGLIKAVTGSKWYGGNTPSVFKLIYSGSKDVTEEQANLLGKTLSLGSMGAAFFMLGYMARKNTKVNDDGSIEVGGMHFSKNLIHSPEFESFFSGAETGNRFEKSKKKDAKSFLVNFAQSDYDIAKKNPFANMLTYGFIPNVATTLLSKQDADKTSTKITDAIARKIGDMVIPGFIKQPAGWLDTKEKGIHPMGNVTPRNPRQSTHGLERFWEIIEKNIPGLRQNVPRFKPKH